MAEGPRSPNRFLLSPRWLFFTIIGVLLFHYVFLSILLGLCVWGIRLNVLAILRRDGIVTNERLAETPLNEELGLCQEIDDDFRNARNKSVEIILALLVPTSAVVGEWANGRAKKRKKREDEELGDPPRMEDRKPPPRP